MHKLADSCYNDLLKSARGYARYCQKSSSDYRVEAIESLIEKVCLKFVAGFLPRSSDSDVDRQHSLHFLNTCFRNFDYWVAQTARDVVEQTSIQPHDDTSDKSNSDCKDKPIPSLERGLTRVALKMFPVEEARKQGHYYGI